MTTHVDANYPGERATAEQVARLADEFRAAAFLLAPSCRRGDPISQSPFRLAAVHAIEPYLNAVLLARGRDPAEVRALQHDLARRAELLPDLGLELRVGTVTHLARLGADREYLVARYCADRRAPPPPNRLAATLDEVARKSRAAIEAAPRPGPRA